MKTSKMMSQRREDSCYQDELISIWGLSILIEVAVRAAATNRTRSPLLQRLTTSQFKSQSENPATRNRVNATMFYVVVMATSCNKALVTPYPASITRVALVRVLFNWRRSMKLSTCRSSNKLALSLVKWLYAKCFRIIYAKMLTFLTSKATL